MTMPAGFPTSGAPIVDENGYLTQQWYNFMATLWRRTGGGSGATATTATFTSVEATGGIAAFGKAPPTVQPAAPATISDVAAILRGAGFSA